MLCQICGIIRELPARNATHSVAGGRDRSMFYYTYVLKSKNDQKLYTGWTLDINRRLHEHNNGDTKSTSNRGQFELVYFEGCLSREKAISREKQLKTGYGRAYLKRRL